MIELLPFNETHIKIRCDDWGVEQEISEFFTFFVPGYRYMPSYKNKMWDGKIRLFDSRRKTIYKGLVNEVIKFARTRDYEVVADISLNNNNNIGYDEVKDFVDSLDLHARGEKLDIREYQYDAVWKAIGNKRQLLLSPTASGKSMIIMSVIRWHIQNNRNILIVVPTTMLVEQLLADFKDYSSANGWDADENCTTLYSGKERIFDKHVVISTWQSIAAMYKSDPKNFKDLVNRTDVGIWDEAHTYKADVVLKVMEQFTMTEYRTGTTGTIDDTKINALVLQGLMGPIHKVISTKELMDAGQVVQLKIKCLALGYPEHIRKTYKGMSYKEEIQFLISYEPRNKLLAKLATSTEGNTLLLFNFVAKHGAVLDKMIRERTDRPVYFIHGGVDVSEREEIRNILSKENNAIIVANSALMSTGVNIPSIEHIIFAFPSKSTIRIRQSIGRGLRLNKGKNKCVLYDVSDDLSYKSYTNTTWNHMEDRIGIYEKEQFDWKLIKLELK